MPHDTARAALVHERNRPGPDALAGQPLREVAPARSGVYSHGRSIPR